MLILPARAREWQALKSIIFNENLAHDNFISFNS